MLHILIFAFIFFSVFVPKRLALKFHEEKGLAPCLTLDALHTTFILLGGEDEHYKATLHEENTGLSCLEVGLARQPERRQNSK